jgi:phage terminase large subunit
MSVQEIQTTVNFEFIENNFDSCRGIVLPGGTRSSKTIATIQWLIIYCHQHNHKHIVICRDTLKNLKRTTLKDFIELCYGYGDYPAHAPTMTLNKAELTAKIGTNTIEFIGLIDDPMRVHGLKSSIFYINEAVGTYKASFTQLSYRCEDGFILDCNPSEPHHWVYELEKREDVKFFRTSFLDNPFLGDEQIKEIKSKEPTPENIERGTADEKEWSIYGLGLVFKGKDIVIPNWDTYSEDPAGYDMKIYGIDWGWNDPFCFVQVIIDGKDLYMKELMYGSHITPEEYTDRIIQEEYLMSGNTYAVCDSSEPKSVNALIENNVPAIPIKKPPGSIMDGLKKLNKYNLHIHEDSKNIQEEANKYKYKTDPRTGDVLDITIDKFNHSFDAVRYCVLAYG